MPNAVFEHPVLNAQYAEPRKHSRHDDGEIASEEGDKPLEVPSERQRPVQP